jgi:mono/diheme cytochrome c family protein
MKKLTLVLAALLSGAWMLEAQQDGQAVFVEKCASCHGPDGAAQNARARKMKMKGIKEVLPHATEAEMEKVVEGGKGLDMPAYAKQLDKKQIEAVVGYFRGLAK